eukprot:GFUD01121180.1.p1 GENE.GFUD01121180.1~~GFUD01121180.1.p1  ORF type:complete len:424 (-),score=140.10 GFUD01121180.1:42-1313(-)
MGFVLSKFRKKKSTLEVLEQLELDIDNISKFKASTVVWQKKVVGYLVTYSIVVYLLLAMLVYFKLFPAVVTRQEQLLLLIPFLVFPGAIWGLRKLLTWWYHRKVRRDDLKLEELKEKKVKILDEVKEKETYVVAKEILDRFGQNQSVVRPVAQLGGGGGNAREDQLRRRAAPAMNTSLPVTVRTAKLNTSVATFKTDTARKRSSSTAGAPQGLSCAGGVAVPLPPVRLLGAGGLSRSAPRPPLPRPVLPRARGYLAKCVEFLVGDGPSNRFALICRQCQSHNGMALREEFEYLAYRCCYCFYWNPARKQRPVAPRLSEETSFPSAKESAGSGVSAVSSAVQPRTGKDKGDRVTVTGEQLSDTTDSKADSEHINQGDDCEVESEVMITSGIVDMGEKLDVKHPVEKAEYEIKAGGDEYNNMEGE